MYKTDPFLWMIEICKFIIVLTKFFKKLNFSRGKLQSGRISCPRPLSIANYGQKFTLQKMDNDYMRINEFEAYQGQESFFLRSQNFNVKILVLSTFPNMSNTRYLNLQATCGNCKANDRLCSSMRISLVIAIEILRTLLLLCCLLSSNLKPLCTMFHLGERVSHLL